MTGRELVYYILENDLLDKPMYDNGKIIGMLTEGEVAVKEGVGLYTVRSWYRDGLISGFQSNDVLYIFGNYKSPKNNH